MYCSPRCCPPTAFFDRELGERGYWLPVRLALFGFLCLVTAFVFGLMGVYLRYAPLVPPFDGIETYQPRLGSQIFSIDNQLIAEFASERRVLVPAEKIPPTLYQAFMSAEDKRFMHHGGLDYVGMVQAVFDKIRRPKEKLRGASTLTQQVAKSLLATHESYELATERSFGRKVREALLARQLERKLSKEQILYLYATQTFFGHKAYGVGAAAEHYFRKNVWELSLAQMATLAGLPQRPSDYSPTVRPQAARGRRKYVLRRMHEDGYITETAMREAQNEEMIAYPRDELYLQMAPYYAEQVRQELIERFGERAVLEDGLRVYTGVNLEEQYLAHLAMDAGLLALDKRQGFRGPLAQMTTPALQKQFRARYLQTFGERASRNLPTLEPNRRYLAMVTGFSATGDFARVDVAGTLGILPLAGMRWARVPHALERPELHYLQDVRKVLSTGDIVFVQKTTSEELMAMPFAPKVLPGFGSRTSLFALDQDPIAQGAVMTVEPFSGYVTTQLGGYDFDESKFNRAVQACREPGSAFKPIVYSAAIDKYDYSASTLIDDKPLIFDDNEHATRWKPNNAGHRFRGRLPLRTCLKDSINTPAIRIADAVGIDDVIKNARRLGISSDLKRELGTALGSSCTTLLELMTVYTTLNQMGERRELLFIRKIVDRFGNILFDASSPDDPTLGLTARLERTVSRALAPGRRVLDPATAFLMVSLLKNVVESGTAMGASHIGQSIAGKTGTTNDAFDAWFMAFTPNHVTGVWVGHDRKERPLGISELGGRTALPIWVDFMKASLMDYAKTPPQSVFDGEFAPPPGVVRVSIDAETGLLSRPGATRSVMEYYREGTEPLHFTPDRAEVNADEVDMYRADSPM